MIQHGWTEGVGITQRKVPGVLLEAFRNVIRNVATRGEWVETGVLVVVVGPVQRMLGALRPVKPNQPQVAVTGAGSERDDISRGRLWNKGQEVFGNGADAAWSDAIARDAGVS